RALAKVLSDLSFAAGAAGFVVPFALLVAGVAVPSLILGLTPRPLAWFGLVVAAIGMVSTLTLLTSALDFTLPIARFGGLILLVAASVLLPASRHRLTVARDRVDVPLGRLEQDQRHIDPVAPPGASGLGRRWRSCRRVSRSPGLRRAG